MSPESIDDNLTTSQTPVSVSVVVPCFNEAGALEQLSERLAATSAAHRDRFDFEFVFVDDGSSDETWDDLQRIFGDRTDCVLVQHSNNRGIAAAIRTGIRRSHHEFVVSMDADCTYDPMQIGDLVDTLRLGQDAVMVTASPYHPQGKVHGIPGWRLALSQTASRIYRVLIGESLHTYTACFRAYRKSVVEHMPGTESGFVGVAEMLWAASRNGRVLECPTVLTSRRVGYSKMKTLPVILGHARLMNRILWSQQSKQRKRERANPSPL
ncbi:MAG: glycosyltransferase [Pirellulales bacterium]